VTLNASAKGDTDCC